MKGISGQHVDHFATCGQCIVNMLRVYRLFCSGDVPVALLVLRDMHRIEEPFASEAILLPGHCLPYNYRLMVAEEKQGAVTVN